MSCSALLQAGVFPFQRLPLLVPRRPAQPDPPVLVQFEQFVLLE